MQPKTLNPETKTGSTAKQTVTLPHITVICGPDHRAARLLSHQMTGNRSRGYIDLKNADVIRDHNLFYTLDYDTVYFQADNCRPDQLPYLVKRLHGPKVLSIGNYRANRTVDVPQTVIVVPCTMTEARTIENKFRGKCHIIVKPSSLNP
ncbi:MAG: hypothetical protein WBG71_04335 [Leeuwenhoekiella sp.]